MAGVLISPKVDSKIRNRNAAYKKKFGGINFRDILRQRCKERIKEKRGALFDHHRPLNSEDEVRSALSDMMHSDMKDISSNEILHSNSLERPHLNNDYNDHHNSSMSSIEFDDNTDDEEKYIMLMYEQLLDSEEAMIDALLQDELICPMCEKGIFKNLTYTIIKCTQCPATLYTNASTSHIKQLIDSGLTTHDQFCSEHAKFAIFNDEDYMQGLFLVCDSCAYFFNII